MTIYTGSQGMWHPLVEGIEMCALDRVLSAISSAHLRAYSSSRKVLNDSY